jgi:hypothetical protein
LQKEAMMDTDQAVFERVRQELGSESEREMAEFGVDKVINEIEVRS